MTSLLIPARFNGPPHSGNGGYVAGRLAAHLGSAGREPDRADQVGVAVTLRSPPPLGVPLEVREVSDGVEMYHEHVLVAEARPAVLIDNAPGFVSLPEARAAAPRFAGLTAHPFPTCFVCGLYRDDGLALQPGPVGQGTVAAAWMPDSTLRCREDRDTEVGDEFAWATLDCPGGWSTDLGGRPMVLGKMTAHILRPPSVGEECVVVGQVRSLDGRKAFTASALYTADAELLGLAEAVWLQVDPASFARLSR